MFFSGENTPSAICKRIVIFFTYAFHIFYLIPIVYRYFFSLVRCLSPSSHSPSAHMCYMHASWIIHKKLTKRRVLSVCLHCNCECESIAFALVIFPHRLERPMLYTNTIKMYDAILRYSSSRWTVTQYKTSSYMVANIGSRTYLSYWRSGMRRAKTLLPNGIPGSDCCSHCRVRACKRTYRMKNSYSLLQRVVNKWSRQRQHKKFITIENSIDTLLIKIGCEMVEKWMV